MGDARPADYLPAARFDFLTPFFDLLVRSTTREYTFKHKLLDQARLDGRLDVLDLGSGSGTLAIWAKERNPRLRIHGLDGDAAIVEQARQKAAKAGVDIPFEHGLSYELPYPDASFDRILSSLFFHHLVPRDKRRTIGEVTRVLRPDGELHIADWGQPQSFGTKLGAAVLRRFDGEEATSDNLAGRIPELLELGGLVDAREHERVSAPLGVVSLYSARRPG